jgi:paraquat-inducible protein A
MNLIASETCGQVQQCEKVPPGHQFNYVRCGSKIRREQPDSRTYTAALALAALFLYIPANLYPIMVMDYLGRHTENTVWGGVKALYQDRMWYVATLRRF